MVLGCDHSVMFENAFDGYSIVFSNVGDDEVLIRRQTKMAFVDTSDFAKGGTQRGSSVIADASVLDEEG